MEVSELKDISCFQWVQYAYFLGLDKIQGIIEYKINDPIIVYSKGDDDRKWIVDSSGIVCSIPTIEENYVISWQIIEGRDIFVGSNYENK